MTSRRHALAAATVVVLAGLSAGATLAQQPPSRPGPLIQSAGSVFDVPHIDFETPLDMTYRVAFDLTRAGTSATTVNAGLDSVARFLNMQARAGVPVERLRVAVVVHGAAAGDVVRHEVYRERTGENNPNAALIDELSKAGVQIIICGQTAASRGITKAMLLEPVDMALSAMTAFAVLQERGYHVNPF